MPDVKEVVNGLEMSYKYSNVDENNTLVPQWIVLHALALLKAQEPRVMAGAELTDAELIEEIRKAPIVLKPNVDAVPVVWKPVSGYEGKYEVSTSAQVRNEHGKILKQGIKRTNGTCYKVVGLCKDGKCHTKYIHRLVAEAFIPNPDCLPFINHKDEDGTNNLIENLEWCTPQYNTTYKDAHKRRGKKLRGILHTEEHKNKISDGLRTYYANNESKSKGRVSEKRKGVILREHLDDPPLYFASVHEADAYLGGGCRANIVRAIRRGGVVRGYYAEWADKMDGERRDSE